jgi:hypothetical protein
MPKQTAKVGVLDDSELPISPATENSLAKLIGFEIPAYDYISMSYTGENLTGVVYKKGGSDGTTVATLTLAYDGSDNLTSVTKT